MSTENSVILITNQSQVADFLKPKLVLLREVDNLLSVNYADSLNKIKSLSPEAVIIYCKNEKQECLEIIKQIRSDKKIKHTSILMLVDKYDQDFLLSAYDEGITDYLTLESDDAEILMRTIWSFKKYTQIKTIQKQRQLLEKLNIVDNSTGFYSNAQSEKIFENELENIKLSGAEAILMLVSPSEQCKVSFDMTNFASAIKSSIRHSDVVIHGVAQKFYILLVDTQLKGAFIVWEKIKQSLQGQTLVSAICQVDEKPFAELDRILLEGLVEAETTGKDLVIVNEEEKQISSDGWLEKIGSAQKNFKLFKQAFNKKLDSVITPVFFQIQKAYEAKLFETEIEQYSNSTQSEFTLKNGDRISTLKITYPGFSKINIDLLHQGLDSPENKRASLDLTELSEAKLTKILEGFIKEFKAGKS